MWRGGDGRRRAWPTRLSSEPMRSELVPILRFLPTELAVALTLLAKHVHVVGV